MSDRASLPHALGSARYQPYLDAADGDEALAADLYLWGTELAGAWHLHLSFIEVLVRNSIGCRLKIWNTTQSHNGIALQSQWTSANGAGKTLYQLIGKGIKIAQDAAKKEARWRHPTHPRHAVIPTHDDIIAQLTFGAWSRLLRFPGKSKFVPAPRALWQQSLRHAFPHTSQDNNGLLKVGEQMERLRILRNRVAHHENLLQVNTTTRLDSSLALLASIDQDYPDLVMARNSLRRLTREDSRRAG